MKRAKEMSFSAGRYGERARVFRNVVGGPIYLVTSLKPKPEPLGTRDWTVAKDRAWDEVKRIKKRKKNSAVGVLTLDEAITAYRIAHDCVTCPSQEYANKRLTVLWFSVLGREKVVNDITKADLNEFMRLRMSGEIDARGTPVPELTKRKPVSVQTASHDIGWLHTAIRFALEQQSPTVITDPERMSPVARYRVAKNPAPRRPVCTENRFLALTKVAEQVTMMVYWDEKPQRVRAPIKEIIQLLAFTGARVGALLQLRLTDLHLDPTPSAPFGYILFPGSGRRNKNPEPWEAVLTSESRPVVDALVVEHLLHEPYAPDDPQYLFPSPRNRREPLRVDVAASWHDQTEGLAELPHLDGGRFHPYRRKHDSELAHVSPTIAAATTGRQDTGTMIKSYMRVSRKAKFDAASNRRPLEES